MSKYQLSVKIWGEYQLSVNPIQTLLSVREHWAESGLGKGKIAAWIHFSDIWMFFLSLWLIGRGSQGTIVVLLPKKHHEGGGILLKKYNLNQLALTSLQTPLD